MQVNTRRIFGLNPRDMDLKLVEFLKDIPEDGVISIACDFKNYQYIVIYKACDDDRL